VVSWLEINGMLGNIINKGEEIHGCFFFVYEREFGRNLWKKGIAHLFHLRKSVCFMNN